MGYELHITRILEGSGGESKPISLEEWLSYVRGDPEMQIRPAAEATSPKGEVIRIPGEGLALWKEDCWFDWRRGKITVKNPSEVVICKMKQIAARLGARVQGDEGEYY